MTRQLTAAAVRNFRRRVRRYYARHGRDLPWRRTADPYAIYVSEVMLQQTQVDRVVDYFTRFLERFPGVATLAAAPAPAVLAAWQGLGYNRRARFLHRAAKEIVARYGGRVPADPADLAALPGIGEATAASIAAFAFNRPVVFIETNIRAVFLHHFFADRDGVPDDAITPLVARTLDRRNPARWYAALMDYGTALKKSHPNPSRRSAHHTRQSPFAGSDRQVRGAVLRLLLDKKRLTAAAIAHTTGFDRPRLERVLAALKREGFIRKAGKSYLLAEE